MVPTATWEAAAHFHCDPGSAGGEARTPASAGLGLAGSDPREPLPLLRRQLGRQLLSPVLRGCLKPSWPRRHPVGPSLPGHVGPPCTDATTVARPSTQREARARRRLCAPRPGGSTLGARERAWKAKAFSPLQRKANEKLNLATALPPLQKWYPKPKPRRFSRKCTRPKNPGCTAARPTFQKFNTSKSDCEDRITDLQHFGGLIKSEAKHIYIDFALFCSHFGSLSLELLFRNCRTKK